MKFIRKNGRIIPIKDKGESSSKDGKAKNKPVQQNRSGASEVKSVTYEHSNKQKAGAAAFFGAVGALGGLVAKSKPKAVVAAAIGALAGLAMTSGRQSFSGGNNAKEAKGWKKKLEKTGYKNVRVRTDKMRG